MKLENWIDGIHSEWKTVTSSRKIYISMMAGLVFLLSSVSQELYQICSQADYPAGFQVELILKAMKSDAVMLGMSVICSLPFATSYIDDIKSHFFLFRVGRSTKKRYYTIKLIMGFFVGGFTVLSAILFFIAVLWGFFLPVLPPDLVGVVTAGQVEEMVSRTWIYFLTGGFFSMTAMAVGSVFMNYYIAYSTSFILFYFLEILHRRYFLKYGILDPREWILNYKSFPFEVRGVTLVILALTFLTGIFFYQYAEGRGE